MLLILQTNTSAEKQTQLMQRLNRMGLQTMRYESAQPAIAILNSDTEQCDINGFRELELVVDILPLPEKLKLAAKHPHKSKTIINVNNVTIGGDELSIMAGPCSVENEEQIFITAAAVKAAGANILRGGAFKPRSSPYDFQGHGKYGLQLLNQAAHAHDLSCISEVMDTKDIELVAEHVDILQVGARNMQNFSLLKELGKINKPVLLKRGLSATYQEFLLAAEYILSHGNPQVILCERGIRTFETYTRNTLDLAAIPVLKKLSHLPIIIDPSHATGHREFVAPMAHAAIAAGADGLIIEVHPNPDKAISDAKQTISLDVFSELMIKVKKIHQLCTLH